jgi:hypothetical protein
VQRQITEIRNSSIALDPADPSSVMPFLKFYFRHVFPTLPCLSCLWIESNILLIPPALLLAMFGSCLMNTTNEARFELVTPYIKAAISLLKKSKAKFGINPFDVVALMHISFIEIRCHDLAGSTRHLSEAVEVAFSLNFHEDKAPRWKCPASHKIHGLEKGTDINFCRAIWYLLFLWDNSMHLLFKQGHLIGPLSVSTTSINEFELPNSNHPSAIPDNYLSHIQCSLPLAFMVRESCNLKDKESKIALLEKLDRFHSDWPGEFLTTAWMGRRMNLINEVYFFCKIRVLASMLFQELDTKHQSPNLNYLTRLSDILPFMKHMAVSFIEKSNGVADPTNFLLHSLFQRTVLIHCLSNHFIPEYQEIEGLLETQIQGLKLTGSRVEDVLFEQCLLDKIICINTFLACFE